MSVNVGDRSQSRLEVEYTAMRLSEELSSLSLRSFGIFSRHSPFRKKYERLIRESSETYVDSIIFNKQELIESLGEKLCMAIQSAKAIYPRYKFEIEQRVKYQNEALAICKAIKIELNKIAYMFDVDVNYFKISIELLQMELHLLREWRKSDRQKFKRLTL